MLKRTKTILVIAISLLFILPYIIGRPNALAGEKGKWSCRDVNCITMIQSTKVPGDEKHSLYLGEAKGLSFIEGRGTVACVLRLTLDYAKGVGPWNGYNYYTFSDGSTITTKSHGETKGGGSGLAGGSGGESTWTFVKGTGKFAGIKGGGTGKYWIIAPGQWYVDTEGDYTLP